jgi:methylphosphotriester-DNA--protein-cysteine methyltransferase
LPLPGTNARSACQTVKRVGARPRPAYAVGYESASQFSRKYARFFGAPPSRDDAHLHMAGEGASCSI